MAGLAPFSVDLAPGDALGVVAVDAAASAFVDVLAGDRPPRTGAVHTGTGAVHTATGPVRTAGTPPAEAHPRRLSRHVLAAPHAVHLFGRTPREMLDSGRGHDPAREQRALHVAGLGDVTAVRGGAVAELADGAADLSGGQRQRLAPARAVAAAVPVLVLHDPLTAVDAVTEDEVAGRLFATRRAEGGVTVVVTSSPPLLARCDRVVSVGRDGVPVVAAHRALLDAPDYAEAVLR
ncbi:hypothetical protein ACIPPJ_25410 [Streptomyces sp. NPDC086091]|uniref:hypothetical protein n=1 Tax=Streptomyces sp. NPDC086091 TaxID=3365751 RepID=UPI0037F16CE0